MPLTDAQMLRELKKEVLDVCQQMKTLTERSRGAQRNSLTSLDTNSSDDVPLHKVKVSVAGSLVTRGDEQGQGIWWSCDSCQPPGEDDKSTI